MLCVDVNVLVHAFRADTDHHAAYRDLIEQSANGEEPLGIPDIAASGFVRIVTSRRIFSQPSTPAQAWERIDDLLAAPASLLLVPGEHHWSHFRRLANEIGASGNDVPDAYLAAYAVENNATWLSADRGFARFRSVRWRHPLDA